MLFRSHGIHPGDTLVRAILDVAKASDHNLSEEEILAVVDRNARKNGDDAG